MSKNNYFHSNVSQVMNVEYQDLISHGLTTMEEILI